MTPQEAAPRRGYHHGNLRVAMLDAGLDLTRTGGAKALVLRDVARRVGVSPNAAYRHFADRDSLQAAVAVRIQQQMVERMGDYLPVDLPVDTGAAGRPAGTARARLTAVGLGYIAFALKEPGWFEVAFAEADALPDTGDEAELPDPLRWLVDALDGLVESGELAPQARPGAEWPCWSAVHGFCLLAMKGPLHSRPADEVWTSAERTVESIIAGLLAGDSVRC